jgi:hypothetical protein
LHKSLKTFWNQLLLERYAIPLLYTERRMENQLSFRDIPGDQAREEIMNYFVGHTGIKVYVVDISKDLKLDVGLVSRIASEMLADGTIQLAETGQN